MRTSALLATSALAAAACTREARPEPPRPVATIAAFSEPAAVTALVPLGAAVFAGTSLGLERWDTRTGAHQRIGAGEGVAGTGIRALALAPAGVLWFATDAGVGRYDIEAARATMLPPPPAPIAGALAGLRALAVDRGGGVWAAGTAGLFHVDAGGWTPTPWRREVTAVHVTAAGELFLGTLDGVVQRNAGGVFTQLRDGSTLKRVVAIAEGPDGAPVAAGEDDKGQACLAVFLEGQLSTFRLDPEARVTAAVRWPGGLALLAAGRLLVLFVGEQPPAGVLPAGVELLHVTGRHKRPPYRVGVLDAPAPPDVTALAAGGDGLLVGTRAAGTARFAFEGGRPTTSWLRGREIVRGARRLFIACQDRADCYLATGGMTAWHYDGQSFAPLAIGAADNLVLAVVRDGKGTVLALYRAPSERMLHVARLVKGVFTPATELRVETPSGASVLSFAKFAPDGLLWLGMQYLDDEGDPRPFGVALVDLAVNGVSYHHEGRSAKRSGVLPIPNDVVDVAFMDDETWFASGSGAARLKGEGLRVWTEADELRSEILHGVVATEGGLVFVASASGVGQFDGSHWSYPDPIAFFTNGIARGPDGRLWLGTDRGLVVFDGKATERFDRRAGLADDRVLDVAVDHFGRVWARSPEGLSILTPP